VTVRIGITGPIGCGKSTVAGWLAELGATVIDADRVARDVTAPGSPTLAQIVARFGSDLVRDGVLDRGALGRIVFSDPAALADLEAIVHPAVRPVIVAEMSAAEHSGAKAVVVEAIKLVEGGLAELCDEVWLVTCAPEQQLARVLARTLARTPARAMDDVSTPPDGEGDAQARIAAQVDMVDRLAPAASRILDTSGSPEHTRSLVAAAYADALAGGAA
jgi:dephospho-CoA kinase